jgi:hypothetical protein
MSFANPTPLRVGARGTLHGWSVTVTGRVVLGVEIDGETYYWNEYYLMGDSGSSGTLVYEETEHGPEWKLFRLFEPERPLTAREAMAKRVGDTVNLDGTPTKVTLVDESRVYHIEGSAPEGVAVGDVAQYFNADTGQRMLVASWTGDEIEFYEGEDAPAELIASAFGFAQPRASSSFTSGTDAAAATKRTTMIVVVVFFLVDTSPHVCAGSGQEICPWRAWSARSGGVHDCECRHDQHRAGPRPTTPARIPAHEAQRRTGVPGAGAQRRSERMASATTREATAASRPV